MRIIGPPSCPRSVVINHIQIHYLLHSRFIEEMFEPLWSTAIEFSIDPVGVVAQSGKETKWGNFSGKVKPEFHNTCGLKLAPMQQAQFPGITDGDNPLAHSMFASWYIGALAHVQHLQAYAGYPVITKKVVDPRYSLAFKFPSEWVENWRDLGGKWAPSLSYGTEIESIMSVLRGV